jgi:hypothetical protein
MCVCVPLDTRCCLRLPIGRVSAPAGSVFLGRLFRGSWLEICFSLGLTRMDGKESGSGLGAALAWIISVSSIAASCGPTNWFSSEKPGGPRDHHHGRAHGPPESS